MRSGLLSLDPNGSVGPGDFRYNAYETMSNQLQNGQNVIHGQVT
jgi:hypothetical protein